MNWKRDWATLVLAIYGALMMLSDLLRMVGWL